MPAGRPTTCTPETTREICARLMEGNSLRSICRDDDMPAFRTVMGWLADEEKYPEFSHQYARAREIQAECWADEIIDIADDGRNDYQSREGKGGEELVTVDHDHIQRSKLRVDSRKWVASRLLPKKYGDKQQITGKDGGPIVTKDTSGNDLARRLAFALSSAVHGEESD